MAKTKKYSARRVAKKGTASRQKSVLLRRRYILKWPLIVFVLLCILVLLVGWTFQATAASPCDPPATFLNDPPNPPYTHCTSNILNVSAKVPAPLPTEPAIITSPADGTHFTTTPITVSGTCPSDSAYVEIYDNGYFRSVAPCSAGTFTLQIDLFPGANQLTPHVFNKTDDEGPIGNSITVYYDVPQQPTAPSSPATHPSSPNISIAPFELSTDFTYKGYYIGQTVYWTFQATGGNPPYAINVDWGDGNNSIISQKTPGNFVASHRYKTAGNGPKSSFAIKVSGADSDGRQAYLQMFVIVNPSGLPNFVANNLPSPHINNNWLLLAWPSYLVLLLMLASFWLGEREEVINLKKRGILRGRSV